MLPKLILAIAVIFSIVSTVFLISRHNNVVNSTKPVVFFGNSITAGQGARAGEDFPSVVGKTLNVPIVNAGVSGDTTGEALARINKDVLSKNPSVVVIELGGNDLMKNINSEITRGNFELILSKIKTSGAKIVILDVKFLLFSREYKTDWRDLAEKYNAIYVPDILDGVIDDQNFKYDDLHPNTKGYQKIAEKLVPTISTLVP